MLAEVVVVGVGWGQSVSGFRLLRLVEPLGFSAVLAGPTSGPGLTLALDLDL